MNSYSAIFIPKINNKLKKIIKGIELLNLINSHINIQTGGSLTEIVNELQKRQVVIYRTEDYDNEYKKMIAKFLNNIELLRVIIIGLLSQLHEKDQYKNIPITMDELDKKIDDSAAIIQRTFRAHKKQKEMSANDIKPDFTFGNIKIYKLTQYNYKSILSLSTSKLWMGDIDSITPIYTSANIDNIYIIHIIKDGNITPFLVSFVNNDLRNSVNEQLKLYIFYDNITTITSNEDKTSLRQWFTTNVKTHAENNALITSGTAYNADSCKRYNIIYSTNVKFNFIKLTIYDKGTTFDYTNKTFGCVPFYIDIYEFISKFTTVTTLHIIGNFNIHFYNNDAIRIETFSKINTLICENVYIFKLFRIIKLFINITDITIQYTDKKSVFPKLNNGIESDSIAQLIELFNYLQANTKIQTIKLSNIFEPQNIEQHIPSSYNTDSSRKIKNIAYLISKTVVYID
jgi:hypothetical protein